MPTDMIYHAKKAVTIRTRQIKVLAAPPAHKHAVELLLVDFAYDSLRRDRQLMGQRLLAPAATAVVYWPSLVARIPVGSAIGQNGCRGCSAKRHLMLSCMHLTTYTSWVDDLLQAPPAEEWPG